MNTDVIVSGPIFDGRADIALSQACEESERRIAILGASMVRQFGARVFRRESNPPYYRFKVEAKSDAPGWKVWDQDVIYGAWLEGVGKRNRTTRFKGYRLWRITAQKLKKSFARDVVESVIFAYDNRWR